MQVKSATKEIIAKIARLTPEEQQEVLKWFLTDGSALPGVVPNMEYDATSDGQPGEEGCIGVTVFNDQEAWLTFDGTETWVFRGREGRGSNPLVSRALHILALAMTMGPQG